ncbi:ribosome maturation factor RimM [Filimonas effusa]|uniref:Ribosome maturation factor RimM n=1 Tax=Filimonas effusa TaxID=2508721 RepID=A0A4Q1D1P9_9BACT|nr:ribosome maturation factor RimM [Filimonas effusa]RXK81714.1 16S rRNA processing protein RimM [Filimonas effusa]
MDYIHIGKIAASFGLKGEVILVHPLNKKLSFKGVEAVFIEQQKGDRLPYFIEAARPKDTNEVYLKLEGIDTPEAAQRIIRKNLWLADADFRSMAGTKSPLSLLGYQLINEGEPLGPVEEVIEQPHQVLLRITYRNNEALIPLHKETLKNIDREAKEVHVVLPEGLLEIYE